MIRLGICDDNKSHREKLYEMIGRAVFKYDEAEFTSYDSGEAVVQAIESGDFLCDLLFLDIRMPVRDGIETARYIRENGIDVDIMFITVSADYVFDGYTYQAFSYLLKPLEYSRLTEEIGRYMETRNHASRCLHINVNGRKEKVLLDKVYYFMADVRKVIIYQKGEEQSSFYAKLGDVEQMLYAHGFIRCHQSYLVNRKYIEGYSRTELTVAGEKLPISRRYIESVRMAMQSDE